MERTPTSRGEHIDEYRKYRYHSCRCLAMFYGAESGRTAESGNTNEHHTLISLLWNSRWRTGRRGTLSNVATVFIAMGYIIYVTGSPSSGLYMISASYISKQWPEFSPPYVWVIWRERRRRAQNYNSASVVRPCPTWKIVIRMLRTSISAWGGMTKPCIANTARSSPKRCVSIL